MNGFPNQCISKYVVTLHYEIFIYFKEYFKHKIEIWTCVLNLANYCYVCEDTVCVCVCDFYHKKQYVHAWTWKSLTHVLLFATPWTPLHTVHGILQARILEWVAFPSPGDLPNPGTELRSPALQADSLPAEPQGKPKDTGEGSLSLLELGSPALQVGSLPTELSGKPYLHAWSVSILSIQCPTCFCFVGRTAHPDNTSVSKGSTSSPHSLIETASAWTARTKPILRGTRRSSPVLSMDVGLGAAQNHLRYTESCGSASNGLLVPK